MRGDAALSVRLLLRGPGLAGMAVGVGGALLVWSTLVPWHVATTTVTMLEAQERGTLRALPAVPATASGWLLAVVGVGILAAGLSLVLDRPVPYAARAVLAAVVVALVLVAVTAVDRPTAPDLAGPETARLTAVSSRLPVGVDLDVGVRTGPGPGVAVVGAGLAAVGALAARRL